MNFAEQFTQNKYLDIKNLVPPLLCQIMTKYSLLREEVAFSPEVGPNSQVYNAHSEYGDTLMETVAHFLLPHMKEKTGLDLCPTYTFFRVYRPGMDLGRHTDRPSCEISTTICLGYNYVNTDPNYNWGMYVDPVVNSSVNQSGGFKSNDNPGTMLAQTPGDAIIYRGCDIEHWRDKFEAAPGSYQVQAFFHYINKDGDFYPELAFDRRKGLGWRNNSNLSDK